MRRLTGDILSTYVFAAEKIPIKDVIFKLKPTSEVSHAVHKISVTRQYAVSGHVTFQGQTQILKLYIILY